MIAAGHTSDRTDRLCQVYSTALKGGGIAREPPLRRVPGAAGPSKGVFERCCELSPARLSRLLRCVKIFGGIGYEWHPLPTPFTGKDNLK